jgi:hypothetical protein
MEPVDSLPYSQVPAICPYPETTPSSSHDPLKLSEHPKIYKDPNYFKIVS